MPATFRAYLIGLAAVALLATSGCSSNGSDTSDTTSTSPDPGVTESASQTPDPSGEPSEEPSEDVGTAIEVTVKGKEVTPRPSTIPVPPGEDIALVLTSDRPSELHVHAADGELELDIKAGTKTYTFSAPNQPGVYEVELHDPDLLLFSLKVQ